MTITVPSARQLAYQDWEFGLFMHFGIRTFYEGHVDWDGKGMSPEAFAPDLLDCNQWILTAKAAGMRYAVLTAKHHDGFANWPSKWTDYSVASSPWRDGQGDVIAEFVQACRRHDMRVGLYYSPADWHHPYEDPGEYNDYLLGQLTELCSNYGAIDIMWFDGCGSEEREYDWPRIIGQVRELQPDILIFNMGDPDFRWVGNEAGLAPQPCWNVVEAVPFSVRRDAGDVLEEAQPRWLPAECDCRIRAWNWFYSDEDEETVKSLRELMGLYAYSVGRGCNLLLNVAPDRRGLLPDLDAQRLREMGQQVHEWFANPLVSLSDFDGKGAVWTALFEHPKLVDCVVIQEQIGRGEHVQRFAIEALLSLRGDRTIKIYEGENIGHKAICRFPPLSAHGIRLRILDADAEVHLREIGVYDTSYNI